MLVRDGAVTPGPSRECDITFRASCTTASKIHVLDRKPCVGVVNCWWSPTSVLQEALIMSEDTQPPLMPRQGLDYRGRVPDASP